MHTVTPNNYILLAIFTVSVSVVVAKIALMTNEQIVFEAACLTAAAVIGIQIFAFTGFKKIEGVESFSIMAPFLSAVGMTFAVSGLFVIASVNSLSDQEEIKSSRMNTLYAGIGCALLALVMLFDTSMVIGGKSMMFSLGPECYILGAL